ncbi:MAG: DMT family transporter [Clostridia bacterium]|nr:DMT family transporter [Clostridia bacterium]
MKRFKGSLFLLITAVIWGTAFVAQSVAMDSLGPFTFNALRMFLGGCALLPVLLIIRRRSPEGFGDKKELLRGGVLCGAVLTFASATQNYAFVFPDVTVGKAGFITTLYVVLVPLIAFVFLRRKLRPVIIPCIILAVAGLYLLCMTGKINFSRGELVLLLCALLFSLHILTADHFSPRVNGVALSCIQFFSASVISAVCALLFERSSFSLSVIGDAWFSIVYAGVISCGVGYTLQIVGQRYVEPSVASLLMSLESVFAVISGWIILQETLSLRELIGCILMFAAVVLSELPEKKKA